MVNAYFCNETYRKKVRKQTAKTQMSKAYAVTEFEKASRKKTGANSTYRGQPKTASYQATPWE